LSVLIDAVLIDFLARFFGLEATARFSKPHHELDQRKFTATTYPKIASKIDSGKTPCKPLAAWV